jgi:glutamate racemase
VNVTSVACPQFVDFVERGITSGRALLGLAHGYLEPLQRTDVDTVVLGCTHYPLLTGLLGVVMGDGVTLVSSADETAREVYRRLTELDMFRAQDGAVARHEFRSTGDPVAFARLAQRFLGPEAAADPTSVTAELPVVAAEPVEAVGVTAERVEALSVTAEPTGAREVVAQPAGARGVA